MASMREWDEAYAAVLGHVALGVGVGIGFAIANAVTSALFTPSSALRPGASDVVKLTAAVQDVAGEMRVIAAQLSTTCARIDRWLDVAVDESELTLPRQSFFAEGVEPTPVSPPTPGAFPTTTAASTPQQGQVTEPVEPSVFDLLRQYDELSKEAAAGHGDTAAVSRREQGAELLLKHREQLEATGDSDALWRLASACWVMAMKAHGTRSDLDESTRAMLHDGLSLAQRAGERGVWQGHKWAAVCVSVLGKHPESLNDRMLKGKLFYDHITAAIELKPDDDVMRYMRGRFMFEVAGIGYYVRRVAAALVGEPPSATYDDALNEFVLADRNMTGHFGQEHCLWRSNAVYAAKCCANLGRAEEARAWCKKALAKTDDGSVDDRKATKQASELLASL